MKVSDCSSQINFGALMGKKEIVHSINGKKEKISTVQYVYPFKDEFKSDRELERTIAQFKRSDFFKKENQPDEKTGTQRIYQIAIQKTLPFTRQEFVNTLRNPNSIGSSKSAAGFINSKNYNTTTIKTKGLLPAKLINGSEIEYII